jgi:hypothetical protein
MKLPAAKRGYPREGKSASGDQKKGDRGLDILANYSILIYKYFRGDCDG